MNTLTSAACTHVGRRAHNEDALFADANLGLFAVADGMGGRTGAGVASQLAIGAVADVFRQASQDAEMAFPPFIAAGITVSRSLIHHRARWLAEASSSRIVRGGADAYGVYSERAVPWSTRPKASGKARVRS